MQSKRNGLPMNDALANPDDIDTVYETCDAEFNSCKEVHDNFKTAKSEDGWVRFYLHFAVKMVCERDGIYLSEHHQKVVARQIARDWFTARRFDEARAETPAVD